MGVEGKGEGEKRAVSFPPGSPPPTPSPLPFILPPQFPAHLTIHPWVSEEVDQIDCGVFGQYLHLIFQDWDFLFAWRAELPPHSRIPEGGKVTNLRQIQGLVLQSSGPTSLAETFPASLFLNETDSLPNHLRELQC